MSDPLPPFERAALLLDLDGTLLDLVDVPDAVVVPEGLINTLRTIRKQIGDALAIVTGRPVETIDRLLGDAPYAVAGEHGGAFRCAPGAAIERPDHKAPPMEWIERATRLAAAHPSTILEQKPRGFGVHFRQDPDAGQVIHDVLSGLVEGSPDFELMQGLMLWEIRPKGINKGLAVTHLMSRPPFQGRLPVFIGDDVTDQDGIRAARSMGGAGLFVPDIFGSPVRVRDWLHGIALRGAWENFALRGA